jgi:hypothetical protein
MKTFILALLLILAIEAVGVRLFVYSGTYNVGVLRKNNSVVDWVLDQGSAESIKHHASGITVPSHVDQRIWDLMAFIEKLPKLSPAESQQRTANTSS